MALVTAGTTLLFAQGTGAERVAAASLAVQAVTLASPEFAGLGRDLLTGIDGYKPIVPSPLSHVLGEGLGSRPLCVALMGGEGRREEKGLSSVSRSGATSHHTFWQMEFEGRLPPEVISAVLERLGGTHVRKELERLADWSKYLEETLPIYMRDYEDRVPEVRDTLLLEVARGSTRKPRAEAKYIPRALVAEVRRILEIPNDAESFLESTVSQCHSQYPVVPREIIRRIAVALSSRSCGLDRSAVVSKTHRACRFWQERHALLTALLAEVYIDDCEKSAALCQEVLMLHADRSGVLLNAPTPVPRLLDGILFDLLCSEASERAAAAARSVLMQRLKVAHPGVPQELFEVVLSYCKARRASWIGKGSFYGTAENLLRQWRLLPSLLEATVHAVVPRKTETREDLTAQAWRWLAEHPERMEGHDSVTRKGRLLVLAQDLLKGKFDAVSGSDPQERVIIRLQVKYPVLTRELITTLVRHAVGLPVVQGRPRALLFVSENMVRHFAEFADHLEGILKAVLPMLPDPAQVRDGALEALAVRFAQERRIPVVSVLCQLSAPLALAQLAATGVAVPQEIAGTRALIRELRIASSARRLQRKLKDVPAPLITAAGRAIRTSSRSQTVSVGVQIKSLSLRWHQWLNEVLEGRPEASRAAEQDLILSRLAALDDVQLNMVRSGRDFHRFALKCLYT